MVARQCRDTASRHTRSVERRHASQATRHERHVTDELVEMVELLHPHVAADQIPRVARVRRASSAVGLPAYRLTA